MLIQKGGEETLVYSFLPICLLLLKIFLTLTDNRSYYFQEVA